MFLILLLALHCKRVFIYINMRPSTYGETLIKRELPVSEGELNESLCLFGKSRSFRLIRHSEGIFAAV
jgi:hypothetical protein